MATKFLKKREVAKLVTENRQPCVFCNQVIDDEVIFGKLYSYSDIQCHYFCVLLSCCLVQKGRDSEGLFGFLYKDIIAEVERSKKHKCSYCGRGGANLGCSVSACRKQFHLPCGRRKNAVSLFYGNYKSFCELHAPKQKISDDVMAKAKERMKIEKLKKAGKIPISSGENKQAESPEDPAMVCVICYEEVQGYPTTQTFWPPCCGRDAWLHRSCLQRMALSAGMHYLKCPLCNDKDNFYDAVCDQGYYLPDRDAAWELEQNAFAEIYNRDAQCAAAECKCPFGRGHDELGMWDIKLCLLCGSYGLHAACARAARVVCAACRPAAAGLEQLETRLAAVIMAEQALEQRARSGPLMPSRMSLRRTKGRIQAHSGPSSSQTLPPQENQNKTESQPTGRLELNLKTPRRPKLLTPNLRELETKLLSPIKMLEQTYLEKGGGNDVVVTSEVIEKIRLRFSKPRPLSAKKKIVNEILDDLFKNVFKENSKSKDPVREFNSPKKSCDITNDLNEALKEITKPSNTNAANADTEDQETETEEAAKIDSISNNKGTNLTRDNVADENSDKENNINESNSNEDAKCDDDSSTSTFVMASEIIALSDDDDILVDTPKKLKTVDIKQDTIDISEKNEIVNNDVVEVGNEDFVKNLNLKRPKKNVVSFKFSPIHKKPIDIETFKYQYLNEVDRKNSEACKRKLESKDGASKRRKHDKRKDDGKQKIKFKIKAPEKRENKRSNIKADSDKNKEKKRSSIKTVATDKNRENKRSSIKAIATDKNRKKKRSMKASDAERNKEKISKAMKKMKLLHKKVKDKHVSIKIRLKECKIKHDKKIKTSYKQYVLKYSPMQNSKVIAKPEVDVTPMKRKYTKTEKSPSDKLVQTSIQSFFFKAKIDSPN